MLHMKNKLPIILFAIFLTTNICASDENENLLFSPKGIAKVHITLPEGKTIDDVNREEDMSALMEIQNSENSSYDTNQLYNGEIIIKGRGNSTWAGEVRPWDAGRKEPDIPIIKPFNHKRSYSIDLVDKSGNDNESPLLDMPEHHKWTLITFFSDKSLMRIPLAYHLGRMMDGFNYSPLIRYVELYVNGDYRGVYGLCEKIERDKNRVDIKKLTTDNVDQLEPRISGGYIIEGTPLDRIDPALRNKSFATSIKNVRFTFTYPKTKNVTEKQINWITDYMNQFEAALYGNSFRDPQRGYLKYIDEKSLIDWYIIQEFAKNIDAKDLFGSAYIYKDRGSKLFLGPIWDFDIAFGNIDYQECYNEDEFRLKRSKWFDRLFQDPNFANKVRDRYDELMPLFDQIPAILKANQKFLEETGCVERNFDTFPILGMYIWPNYAPLPTSHHGEVQRLIEWTESRKVWLYINMGTTEAECTERLKNSRPIIRIMDPEKFKNQKSSEVRVMRGYGTNYMKDRNFSYTWTHNESETNRNSEKYIFNKEGKHYVQLVDNKGNRSLPSFPVAWGEDPTYYPEKENTSIENPNENDVFLFSNLVTNYLTINSSKFINSELIIRIFNANGSLSKEFKRNTKTGSNHFELNVSDLENGMYLLQITDNSSIINKKFIISR